jgi:MoaA/NifB/PqqE/SkfB family radical SAM enzyme
MKKLHGSIIITYRCNAKCNMCNVWKHPSAPREEIDLEVINRLPKMFFANVTGGEPFIRKDIHEIIEILRVKARRIVISTNGFFTQKITDLCQQYPDLGIRLSVEGLPRTNDSIRKIPDGFDRSIRTLLELRAMGIKDIGLAITVQDLNYADLIPLYNLARALGYEFATACLHNSHYFYKWDNKIGNVQDVRRELQNLTRLLLKSRRPKDWFRAYFNYGLDHYVAGQKRYLPCEMGQDGFFLDPFGDVLACNGMDQKLSMGNLREQTWDEIWNGDRAEQVRQAVKNCRKSCWMIGSAAPAIWHHPIKPMLWVMKNKFFSR